MKKLWLFRADDTQTLLCKSKRDVENVAIRWMLGVIDDALNKEDIISNEKHIKTKKLFEIKGHHQKNSNIVSLEMMKDIFETMSDVLGIYDFFSIEEICAEEQMGEFDPR